MSALADKLVGKTVTGLLVSKGEWALRFLLGEEAVDLVTSGDCCSETWFADITGMAALIGGTVTAVEDVDLPAPEKPDGRSRQDDDSFYGIKITTDRGRCDIVYRNSSNGYYGGWSNVGAIPAGEELRPITDDWSAS